MAPGGAGTLEAAGYTCAGDISDADVIVYNTCSIRDKAEQKVYSALGKQARRCKQLSTMSSPKGPIMRELIEHHAVTSNPRAGL